METSKEIAPRVDLGTFEGFNFREQAAIERRMTADDVIGWNHDKEGEAEFWPAGDNPAVAELFKPCRRVTGSELEHLANLLADAWGYPDEVLLRVHFLVNLQGEDLMELTTLKVEQYDVHLFRGDTFIDVRRAAAFELFELYWPEVYSLWEKTPLDGLRFDPDEFLDSPGWTVEEVNLGATKWLLVAAR